MADNSLLKSLQITPSTDGRLIKIDMIREDGSDAHVIVAANVAANLVVRLEQAIGEAWETSRKYLKGADPRTMNPISAR